MEQPEARPGPVTFYRCTTTRDSKMGRGGHWAAAPQHTAIIEAVNGNMLGLIHQNFPSRTVTRGTLDLGWRLVRGTLYIYRPVYP